MYPYTYSENQIKLVQEGALPPLISMLRSFEENLQMLAAACMRNMALDNANKVRVPCMHVCAIFV
jgi:hypothetical protein